MSALKQAARTRTLGGDNTSTRRCKSAILESRCCSRALNDLADATAARCCSCSSRVCRPAAVATSMELASRASANLSLTPDNSSNVRCKSCCCIAAASSPLIRDLSAAARRSSTALFSTSNSRTRDSDTSSSCCCRCMRCEKWLSSSDSRLSMMPCATVRSMSAIAQLV